jgi:hypothetical protein
MKRRVILLLCVVVLSGLAFVPAAAAAPPIDVSGKWTWAVIDEQWVDGKIAGGNAFFSGAENGTWTGTFNGTAYETFAGVVHRDGNMWVKFTINFAGTVVGRTGTMVMEMVTLATKFSVDGSWRIVSGTDELAGLKGEGTWWWSDDPMASYTGKVHW